VSARHHRNTGDEDEGQNGQNPGITLGHVAFPPCWQLYIIAYI
jgi:hypothetical protein